MDFIERIFGLAPDGGAGSVELLLLLAPMIGIAFLQLAWRRKRRRTVSHRG